LAVCDFFANTMKVARIDHATNWFEVLQTRERTQTAMMTLAPGDSSGEKTEADETSDQVLLVLDGKLAGEVGDERSVFEKGDVIIPAGAKHRFTNHGKAHARTFNVYSPLAYPAHAKG
jgi:mannose-6-phosphate isomerase-like protein (cupin superfamily)